MKAGASDYLSKGMMSPQRLHQSILHAVHTRRIEDEARVSRSALERYTDQLRMLAAAATEMNAERRTGADTRVAAADEVLAAADLAGLGLPPATARALLDAHAGAPLTA